MTQPRIVYVTGKGGVGKTTVCAGLGLAASQRGLRTVVAEPSGAAMLPALFSVPASGYKPTPLAPDLYSITITAEEALEDYVVQQIKFRSLYRAVFRNRVMGPFVDGVPGLHEAVQLGKVFDLERERDADGRSWDLIIVDAPATGHGLSLLTSAESMSDLARRGPLAEGAREVDAKIRHPTTTAIVLVALPESLPVSETIDLWKRLGERQQQVRACVLNRCHPTPRVSESAWDKIQGALLASGGVVSEAAKLTESWAARHTQQNDAMNALRSALDVDLLTVPSLLHGIAGAEQLAPVTAALQDLPFLPPAAP